MKPWEETWVAGRRGDLYVDGSQERIAEFAWEPDGEVGLHAKLAAQAPAMARLVQEIWMNEWIHVDAPPEIRQRLFEVLRAAGLTDAEILP